MYRGQVLVPGTTIRHGNGEYTYSNKCFKYEGQYENGMKHGKGIMHLPNGFSYEGDFKNGEMTGTGLRRWADGTTYSGSFKMGEMNGQGIWISPSGDQYDGEFVDNKRHGEGELTLSAKGTVYQGTFVNHKYHGNGIIVFDDNTYSSKKDNFNSNPEQGIKQFEGNFNKNEIDGNGKMIYKDNSQYVGKWVNGRREGPSEFVGKEGSRFQYKGNYENGIPTETASKMKLIDISDEWSPPDEEELKELPSNEKWRSECAIEMPRQDEEESDDDEDDNEKKPKAEYMPAFIIPDKIKVQIVDEESGECAKSESGRKVSLSIHPIVDNDDDEKGEKTYDDKIAINEPISFYLKEQVKKNKFKYTEKKSIIGFVNEKNTITFNGLSMPQECDDGEYVIVVTDIDNQINFNDDLDTYQSLPVFHAVHLYAGVSNPKAKKGGGGKGKKKKKKK